MVEDEDERAEVSCEPPGEMSMGGGWSDEIGLRVFQLSGEFAQ